MATGIDNSKIITGLPNLPSDQIDPKLWSEFQTIYSAINNAVRGITQYTAIDPPDTIERQSMPSTRYLVSGQGEIWYPTAGVALTRGQIVSCNNLGQAVLADATTSATPAIGVALETKAAGQNIAVQLGGLVDAIGGMVTGTLYYTSTTPGAIQNLRPVAVGNIIQGLGIALTPTLLWLKPSMYFQQL